MSYSEIKCDNTVPMGLSGPLIGNIPILSSNISITFPIFFKIFLSDTIILNDNYKYKLNINKVHIDKNKNLILRGYILKKVLFIYKNCPFKKPFYKFFKISFNQKFDISSYIQCSSKNSKISLDIKSVEIDDNLVNISEFYYCNTFSVNIKASIYENKDVFIPETEGIVILLNNDSSLLKCKYPQIKNPYNIGYNSDVGLVAKKV